MLRKRQIILDAVCIGVIVLISLPYIMNFQVPYLHTDEYGYWGSAAFFAGYNWANTTSTNGYFSYGYGFILSILFKVTQNPIVRFKLSLACNVVFTVGLFYVLNQIANYLYKDSISSTLKKIVCLAATLYCSVIAYIGMSLPECLLTFLYAINIWLVILYVKKQTAKKEILIIFVSIYMYMVHQRTIAVLFMNTGLILYGILFEKTEKNIIKKKVVHCFLICCFVAVLFWGCEEIKEVVQQNVWTIQNVGNYNDGTVPTGAVNNAVSTTVANNDYSGLSRRISDLFSVEGFKSFFFNFTGRFFNMTVGTFGMIIPVCGYLLKGMIDKTKEINKKVLYFYLLCSAVLAVAVSSVFMIGNMTATYSLYGRYTDHIMPIYILFMPFVFRNNKFTVILRSLVVIICLAFILNIKFTSKGFDASNNTFISHVATSNFYFHDNFRAYKVTRIVSCVFLFNLLFAMTKFKYKYYALMIPFILVHMRWGYNAVRNFYKPAVMDDIDQVVDVAFTLKNANIDEVNVIVSVTDEGTEIIGKNDKYGKIVQFINEGMEVNLMLKEQLAGEKGYYIVRKSENDSIEDTKRMYENGNYMVLYVESD